MTSLDEGSITVLGCHVDSHQVLQVGHRVGYMPQETALVDELTVRETVYYFGNIFQMNPVLLRERYEIVRKLLELPPDDFRVEKCSGGEKRRISFTAAVIHEPDLLILDEPTVGLDSMLRDKLWNYLWNTTRTTKLSVIITTHYIAEAQRSDRVGLMRNGVLLAEDSPARIMAIHNTENLDEAFFQLCNLEKGTLKPVANEIDDNSEMYADSDIKAKEPMLRWTILKELMKKQAVKFQRQPA